MALMLRPLVDLIEVRLKHRRLAAVVILYVVVAALVAAGMILVTPALVEQILDFIAFIPVFWQNALNYVQTHYPAWVELAERQMTNPTIKSVVDSLLDQAQQFLTQASQSCGFGRTESLRFYRQSCDHPHILVFFPVVATRSDRRPE